MADDDNTGGFDDWLEEEPGPDTDPIADLATDDDDDVEAEISDWMAFTHGDEAAAVADDATEENVVVDLSRSDEIDADAPDLASTESVADDEPTMEIAIGEPSDSGDELDRLSHIPVVRPTDVPHAPATTVDLDEFDGGGRADTDETPIVAAADVVAARVTSAPSTGEVSHDDPDDGAEVLEPEDETAHDDGHDTGELEVVDQGAPADVHDDLPDEDTSDGVDLHVVDTGTGDDAAEEVGGRPEFLDLTHEDYLGAAATREHDSLAAAIAEADTEDTAQVALTAQMAGLESTVVGFEDVVEAEGHGRVRARRSGDLVARVITAIVLIAALAASLVWRPALVALASVVFVIGAGEFYTALRRSGRLPIALFGFIGILGAGLGAYAWGAVAIPTSFFLVMTMLLLFYAVVPGRVDPMGNLALTIVVMVWVGLGAFAMLIADSDDYRPLIVGVVVTVAAMDIAQYFVGRGLGRHKLSPWVSPKKTVEGLVGGVIVAFAVGASLHFFPPFELTSGLAIGAATAVLVPAGDLAMSAAKRSLNIKDMGSILPGHGGFLDRIDGLIFVIPAAWAIFVWAGLL